MRNTSGSQGGAVQMILLEIAVRTHMVIIANMTVSIHRGDLLECVSTVVFIVLEWQ